MYRVLSVFMFLLFCAGCRFLDLSDEQVNEIAKLSGDAAANVVTATTSPLITPGAGAGVGAVAGLGIAGLVKLVIGMLNKKKVQ